MTAIPGDQDPSTLQLICDNCGRTMLLDPPSAHWWSLWEQALIAGWQGFNRRVGPHTCAHCVDGG
ncbi:hypothetical protein [Saccharothrix obliqua]|uniref:hypothetical protein n=1 Tax=Saccharothrix obliqua TaxID=2861747 RepID=UPI001C5F930A|nr:hypothetical protein [Saccharothrix obliqua]MBW4716781.1 hypothetical protein [Saccharothrix obliqua]